MGAEELAIRENCANIIMLEMGALVADMARTMTENAAPSLTTDGTDDTMMVCINAPPVN